MENFEFLNSFRGLLSLSVIIFHVNPDSFKLVHGVYFGVIGFFILSSFLLTYRLIIQYEQAK